MPPRSACMNAVYKSSLWAPRRTCASAQPIRALHYSQEALICPPLPLNDQGFHAGFAIICTSQCFPHFLFQEKKGGKKKSIHPKKRRFIRKQKKFIEMQMNPNHVSTLCIQIHIQYTHVYVRTSFIYLYLYMGQFHYSAPASSVS